MRPTDLADPAWLTDTVREHHRELGLPVAPVTVDLLDACVKNPHLPDSPRCRGWATLRVPTMAEGGDPLFLLRSVGDAAAPSGTPVTGLPLRAWRFPDDPGLPLLATMVEPERVRALLPERLAGHTVEEVRVVRWQPGISATLRCGLTGPGGRTAVYAKLFAPGDHGPGELVAVEARQRLLHADAPQGLSVAEPLGLDTQRRVLWTREVVGRSLVRDADGATMSTRSAEVVGAALAALHTSGLSTSPVRPIRTVSPEEVATEARKKTRKIASARPEHARSVRRLAALASALTAKPRVQGTLHGDFHLDQVLLTDEGPVLLDLDEMATGDPALDLAEIAVDVGLRRLPRATSVPFLDALGQSYVEAGGTPPPPAVLRGYAAAELLNRCYRRLRRPVPGWEQGLEHDLAAAHVVLTGAALTAPRTSRSKTRTMTGART
ncbi:MAG TPA: phosphotransferase [Marmoricola sp.]|nr:phosphotransferase [Marmoricola sp.]